VHLVDSYCTIILQCTMQKHTIPLQFFSVSELSAVSNIFQR
jgi:hypothetical protein